MNMVLRSMFARLGVFLDQAFIPRRPFTSRGLLLSLLCLVWVPAC